MELSPKQFLEISKLPTAVCKFNSQRWDVEIHLQEPLTDTMLEVLTNLDINPADAMLVNNELIFTLLTYEDPAEAFRVVFTIGCLDALKWIYQHYKLHKDDDDKCYRLNICEYSANIFKTAAASSRIDIMQWIWNEDKYGFFLNSKEDCLSIVFLQACKNINMDVLNWFELNHKIPDYAYIIKALEFLQNSDNVDSALVINHITRLYGERLLSCICDGVNYNMLC